MKNVRIAIQFITTREYSRSYSLHIGITRGYLRICRCGSLRSKRRGARRFIIASFGLKVIRRKDPPEVKRHRTSLPKVNQKRKQMTIKAIAWV